MERSDPFLQTYTGRRVSPVLLHDRDVCETDIAHALSLICRWGGHSNFFYSVAQHSINVATSAQPADKLAALLHDATEAYMGDVIRPLRQYLPEYQKWELWNREVIYKFFNVYNYDWERIRKLDNQWLLVEANALITGLKDDWFDAATIPYPGGNFAIFPEKPEDVEKAFLRILYEYRQDKRP